MSQVVFRSFANGPQQAFVTLISVVDELILYSLIKRSSVQASLPSSFLGIQPEFLIAGVRWQAVSRFEEIGYGNRFIWLLQRYRQRDEQTCGTFFREREGPDGSMKYLRQLRI